MNRLSAACVGCVLAALPFLQGGLFDRGGHAAHMDHEPHHGGSLLMLGHYHLETLATSEGGFEVFVSDAERRPLRAETAFIAFDDGPERDLPWDSYRLRADAPPSWRHAALRIVLDDGALLSIRLPLASVGRRPREGGT